MFYKVNIVYFYHKDFAMRQITPKDLHVQSCTKQSLLVEPTVHIHDSAQ